MKNNYFLANFTLQIFLLLICIGFSSCTDDSRDNPTPQGPDNFELFRLDEVSEIELEFSLAQWNAYLQYFDQNEFNEKKVVAKFTYKVNGETVILDSIGVKPRGNSSRRRPEGVTGQLHDPSNTDWHHAHFGLDFAKNRPTQKFEGREKLILKWFHDDANYAREIYCYDLFNRFDVWTAPRASYTRVSVKVEGDSGPAYFGVYAMIESVDEDYIANRATNWGAAPGFLWKGGHDLADGYIPDFFSTNSMGVEDVKLNHAESQYFAYDLKTRKDELSSAQAELTSFITDLNTKTGAEFESWIAQKMDIDLFLKTYAVNVMVGMWDDYWVNTDNFYFYMSPNGKCYFIPYDYDKTLGTSAMIDNTGTQNPLNWGPSSGRPLVTKILEIPAYSAKYQQYISELAASDNLFAPTGSMSRIASWQMMIAPFVSNDTGEDMSIGDQPAFWSNTPFYKLSSGNNAGGANGNANFFSSRIHSLPW